MSWTQAEIDALEQDLKGGARKVKYEDREIEYRSRADIQKLLDQARREIGTGKRGRRFTLSSSSKGL